MHFPTQTDSFGLRREKKKGLEALYDSIQIGFFNNYKTVYRHQIQKKPDENNEETTETLEIPVDKLPKFQFPKGAAVPPKRDGVMPPTFPCPILTDFIMLKNSTFNPETFLLDTDVFTTLSALRSLLYQWINNRGPKADFFKKNLHYCHMDEQGRLYLNSGTNYTVPLEKSTAFLNRFTILEHGQTWDEFTSTSYSGLGKIHLNNGIRVAFTYKMYAQSEKQPVDIILRNANMFQREIEFHFLNCFLTKKMLWRYDLYRNRTVFQESLGTESLWNRLSVEKQMKLIDCFEFRLPEFLMEVAYGIETEEVVNALSSVTSSPIRLTPKTELEVLY